MGTRSLTIVKEKGERLVTIYRHFDGYPDGHGEVLATFLSGMKITNGISLSDQEEKTANGMGCLAAQTISYLKDSFGGIYIYSNSTNANDCDAEYVYVIDGEIGKEPNITVLDAKNRTLHKGSATEVLAAIKTED